MAVNAFPCPIDHVKPYKPSTTLADVIANKKSNPLKLDWNESTIEPPESVTTVCVEWLQKAGRCRYYPHLKGDLLRTRLESFLDISKDSILITNGSDDALKLICDTFLTYGSSVLIPNPSYTHFVVHVEGNDAKCIKYTPQNPFENVLSELIKELKKHEPTMCYLISPNNPTGTVWTLKEVEQLLTQFPKTLFLIDEAYVEFAPDPNGCKNLVKTFQNIIVTRTFSKAYALASFRIGYLLAHPETINSLLRLYNVKSINEMAQLAAVECLNCHKTYYQPYIEEVKHSGKTFAAELEKVGINVQTGHGNFVCVKTADPGKLLDLMKKRNIYIRNINGRFPGYVRMTLGTKAQMKRVKLALIESVKIISEGSQK